MAGEEKKGWKKKTRPSGDKEWEGKWGGETGRKQKAGKALLNREYERRGGGKKRKQGENATRPKQGETDHWGRSILSGQTQEKSGKEKKRMEAYTKVEGGQTVCERKKKGKLEKKKSVVIVSIEKGKKKKDTYQGGKRGGSTPPREARAWVGLDTGQQINTKHKQEAQKKGKKGRCHENKESRATREGGGTTKVIANVKRGRKSRNRIAAGKKAGGKRKWRKN